MEVTKLPPPSRSGSHLGFFSSSVSQRDLKVASSGFVPNLAEVCLSPVGGDDGLKSCSPACKTLGRAWYTGLQHSKAPSRSLHSKCHWPLDWMLSQCDRTVHALILLLQLWIYRLCMVLAHVTGRTNMWQNPSAKPFTFVQYAEISLYGSEDYHIRKFLHIEHMWNCFVDELRPCILILVSAVFYWLA